MDRAYEKLLIGVSFSRVFCGVLFIFLFFKDDLKASAIGIGIVIFAQITDFLDGWIARNFSQPTAAGYMQDSFSDKAFQIAVILTLSREFGLPVILIWLVMLREVAILALRVIRKFNHEELQKLRPHSIAFAFFLRVGSLLLILAAPIAAYVSNEHAEVSKQIGIAFLYCAMVPGSTGLFFALNARRI